MRRILLLLTLPLVAVAFSACTSDCGTGLPPPPAISLHWPMTLDPEVQTVAGERMRVRTVRVMEAPAWQAVTANPNACLPPAPMVVNPCGPVAGPPESVPAFRAPTK